MQLKSIGRLAWISSLTGLFLCGFATSAMSQPAPRHRPPIPRPSHYRHQSAPGPVVVVHTPATHVPAHAAAHAYQPSGKWFDYNCTQSYISSDPGYGTYTSSGGCRNGMARMEMTTHRGTVYEAAADCERRGLRLPSYHELSAAGRYADQLGLESGNFWAESVGKHYNNQNCYMPTGNCGSHNGNDVQYYRCVYPLERQQQAETFTTYNCTQSYISSDPGYGSYTNGGGCRNGLAQMEMVTHRGTVYEAAADCERRGLRLPTYHELSAAGRYADQLGLESGNFWAESVGKHYNNQNCYMPTGNCGSHNGNDVQYYRCVVK